MSAYLSLIHQAYADNDLTAAARDQREPGRRRRAPRDAKVVPLQRRERRETRGVAVIPLMPSW